MSSGSIHDKLNRVRKPRVHITYEVETNGAAVLKELPFVVGVMGDFSGNPTQPLKPLKDRNFVDIDRDNFDAVMRKMTPGLTMRVEDTITNQGEMSVNLSFGAMDDFSPAAVARQVEPLRKLLETRDKLKELVTKIDKSDALENVLEEVLKNTEAMKKLTSELEAGASGEAK